MKSFNLIAKILAALAAIAGAIYVVATYGDKIVAWAKSMMPNVESIDEEIEEAAEDAEDVVEEVAEAVEEAVEEAAEAVEEAVETVVADEADFAE